jgi:two-component system chemotaxis response regulator CheY
MTDPAPRALVVDDSRAMRTILARILGDIGFAVVEARHGGEALVQLDAHPDTVLALIDWNMPEMNGLDLVTALRQNERFTRLKVVMVTSETEMARVAAALAAGADEYIMKPFTRPVLEDKLHALGLVSGVAR